MTDDGLTVGPPGSGDRFNPDTDIHVRGLDLERKLLIGRNEELQELRNVLTDPETKFHCTIAPGGVGKSAANLRLLNEIQTGEIDLSKLGYSKLLAYTFYSQGTTEERLATADDFLHWALTELGYEEEFLEGKPAEDRARILADYCIENKILLYLDGIEPLQYGLESEEGDYGQLKDGGMHEFLTRFLRADPNSTILGTSRVHFTGLENFKESGYIEKELGVLSDKNGAELLKELGVVASDPELRSLSSDWGSHPLALVLLGNFVSHELDGDPTKLPNVPLGFGTDYEGPGRHAWRMLETFYQHFGPGSVESQVLKLLGLFDRPVDSETLNFFRESEPISGLTDAITSADPHDWQAALERLRKFSLISAKSSSLPGQIDAHPLVREYFGGKMIAEEEHLWRAGHNVLFEHLTAITSDRPEFPIDNKSAEALYTGVRSGVLAGRPQDAFDVLYNRIWRKEAESRDDQFYTLRKLGMAGTARAIYRNFFETPWSSLRPGLEEKQELQLLNELAVSLRTVGRLKEGAEVFESVVAGFNTLEASEPLTGTPLLDAAYSNVSMSEFVVLLGDYDRARELAERAREFADRAEHKHFRIQTRTQLSEIARLEGKLAEANRLILEALDIQLSQDGPEEVMYSQSGLRAAKVAVDLGQSYVISERIGEGNWGLGRTSPGKSLLAKAIDAHVEALVAENKEPPATPAEVSSLYDRAIELYYQQPYIDYKVRGWIDRGTFLLKSGDIDGAIADFETTVGHAQRCNMVVIEAPAQLGLAEAYYLKGEVTAAQRALARAQQTVAKTPYFQEELARVEQVLAG